VFVCREASASSPEASDSTHERDAGSRASRHGGAPEENDRAVPSKENKMEMCLNVVREREYRLSRNSERVSYLP